MARNVWLAAGALLLVQPVGAVSAQPPAEGGLTVEQRLQQMEDREAIRDLSLKYANCLTARDFDCYVELFTPDGVWQNGDIVKRGRDEIKAMLIGMFPDTPADYVNNDSFMVVSNVEVQLDGPDRAHGRTRQLSIMRGKDGSPTPLLAGRYEDELVKVDGEWKFKKREDITLMPSHDEWQKRMAEGVLNPE